jgi:KaiC/GvpD/RAD55 family RecA-like ATPase
VDRVKTGIPGFDELVEGGIPKGFNVLLTGTPGTGKTIFGLQYLYNGTKEGENGLYISLESSTDLIRDQGAEFGWDLKTLEGQGKITFLHIPMDVVKLDLFKMIEDAVATTNAKRIVFDSLEVFAINIDQFTIPITYIGSRNKTVYTGGSEKRITYLVVNKLGSLGTTNMIITDATQGGSQLTVDGVSEYLCDGLVVLSVKQIAKKAVRSIEVKKMRNTNHGLDSFVLSFSDKGLSVEKENVYEGSKISGISP